MWLELERYLLVLRATKQCCLKEVVLYMRVEEMLTFSPVCVVLGH